MRPRTNTPTPILLSHRQRYNMERAGHRLQQRIRDIVNVRKLPGRPAPGLRDAADGSNEAMDADGQKHTQRIKRRIHSNTPRAMLACGTLK
jgi:hypothetical protein